MFTILALAFTLGVVVADVGYQYKVPVNTFGASSSQINNYYNRASLNPVVTYGKGSGLTTGTIGQGSTISSSSLRQGTVIPVSNFGQTSNGISSFGQTSSGTSGSFGQGLGSTRYTGSIGQSSIVPSTIFSQTSKGQTSFGQRTSSSSGVPTLNRQIYYKGLPSTFNVASGPVYKVANPSVSSTKYVSGSTGSNYNTFGTTGGAGSSSSVSGSNTDTNYNTVTSGTNTYVPAQQPSNFGSYNTYGSGSNYNGANQQGVYYPGFGQNQGNYVTTVDTSSLDNIGNYYQTASANNQFISSNQYQTAAVQNYQDYYNIIQQQPAQVFKHYYVHAAPEDVEPLKPRPQIILPPPQKHYKIIFIKAPTQQPAAPQVIPVPQQTDEKTIVYVLVKKPEDAKNIVLPKFEPKAPTKPDVFFIKYNDKQDSQYLIDRIVSDYNKGGVSATFSGISGGLTGSGYKTGSSQIITANKNVNDNSGTLDAVFGTNTNVGSAFVKPSVGISSTTPSTTSFGTTISPSRLTSVFDNRFGNSEGSSSILSSGNVVENVGSELSSGSSYVVNAKPTLSFNTVSTSKPSFGSSSSYSSGSSSTSGSNTGVLVTKPISTFVTGTNTINSGGSSTLVPISSANVGKITTSGNTVTSINNPSYKPSVSFGSGVSAFSAGNSGAVGTTGTGSFPSTPVSSTLSPVPNALSSPNIGSSGSSSSTSNKVTETIYVTKPLSNSSPSIYIPGSANSFSSGYSAGNSFLNSGVPKPSLTTISESTTVNRPSLVSSSTPAVIPALGVSGGVGTSKFSNSNSFNTGNSNTQSSYKTSVITTSQGVPHAVYGPPKFTVL